MRRKRRMAYLVLTAMLAGMMPAATFAETGVTICENHQEHDGECGYVEGHSCGHLEHTADCYTGELVCTEGEEIATGSDADLPHEHTQECYGLDCPHERGEHDAGCGFVEEQPCGHVCQLCAPEVEKEENLLVPRSTYGIGDITGSGYSFDADSKELNISDNDGTQAWKKDTRIDKDNVTSVVLGEGVTQIGNQAFEYCVNLERVEFPGELTNISSFAFDGCKNLELTSLPNSVTKIGNGAFRGCKKLELTALPDNLTAINEYAFSGCTMLKLAALPDGVTSIGSHAFYDCVNLALTELSESITSIGMAAFWECKNLTLMEFPESITFIDRSAFWNCENLALTDIPGKVASIGENAFSGCTGIKSLTFSRTSAPAVGVKAFKDTPVLFVPYNGTGYDGANWPTEKVVYGAALSDLSIHEGTLAPTFFPGTYVYNVSVAEDVENVTLTPTAHASETIAVNGTTVSSGDTSGQIALRAGGITTIPVVVKNSGVDIRTYSIRVKRGGSGTVLVTGVTLDKTALTLYTKQNPGFAVLTATVEPEDATDQTVSWSSSNPAVAKVDGNGRVTAVSPGSAIITVTTADDGRKASCTVTVETGGSASGGGNPPSSSSSSSSSSSTSYIRRVLTDKATGITVAGDRIHENAVLTVKAGEMHGAGDVGCDILRMAQAGGHVLSDYEITLSHVFLGKVKVSIPVEGRDGQTLTVAHCINGRLILSDVTVSNGLAELEVEELSHFAVLDGVYTVDTLTAPAAPAANVGQTRRYRVQKGDTLSAVAKRYNSTVAAIVKANPIIKNPNVILPGWEIEIP